jgi:hypothetical protein
MGLTGDHFVGTYEGHEIELVRNNWVKTLTLLIDGEDAERTTCHLPRRITLSGSLVHHGVRHEVVARSVPRYLFWTTDTIEVDGRELTLTRTK